MELSTQLGKEINKKLDKATSFDEVALILKEYSEYELKGSQLGRAFEKMFVKEQGFSLPITMQQLQQYHHSFYTTNGGDWCRSNQSYLGKKYNIERIKSGGRISAVKIDGFNKKTKINQAIRADILKTIQTKKCVILDISSNIECDHKDGMKDDWRLNDKSFQKLDDFQPLSKTANDAKRGHCKKCREQGIRYDARKLGYSEAYVLGSAKTKTCVGCYWYDPKEFNRMISKDFKKTDK